MALIYLILVCIFFSVQFVFYKLYQTNTDSSYNASAWMLLISALTVLICLAPSNLLNFHITYEVFMIALLYTGAFFVCTFSTIPAMKMGNLTTLTALTLIGSMILPFAFGVLQLGEALTFSKLLGVILIMVSLLTDLRFDKKRKTEVKDKGKNRILYLCICILVFVSNGMVAIAIKVLAISKTSVSNEQFLIITAIMRLFAALISIYFISLKSKKKLSSSSVSITKDKTLKGFFFVIILGGLYSLVNMLGNVYSIKCAALMNSSVQFPIVTASVLVLTSILSFICFREKLKTSNVLGVVLAIVGIVIYSIKI